MRTHGCPNHLLICPYALIVCAFEPCGSVWGTGQDQMRIIKQRLVEMLPEARVFLDVDDLKEVSPSAPLTARDLS